MQIPIATYRIQFHKGFTFRDLEAILDYLEELGISTIYASPITSSIPGSMHGYDTIDPLMLNPEIGTEEDLERLAAKLKKKGMNWLQDIVPNHMAYHHHNPWVYDLLEKGRNSEYHDFFDIDWEHPDPILQGKLMVPFLGKELSACLTAGEIQVDHSGQKPVLRYFDNQYPLAEDSYSGGQTDLAEIISKQHYTLTDSALTGKLINYRRFFTVNSLICLRMESEAVFLAYHAKILDWYRRGLIQGLRIDHIDGLAHPAKYIDRLKDLLGQDCYIVAEKILQADEKLPSDWRLEGTTGYEFLFLINQVLADLEGSSQLLRFYRELVPETPGYKDVQFSKKFDFLTHSMGGELDNLARALMRVFHFPKERVAEEKMKKALAILMACFPVYRIYPTDAGMAPETRQVMDEAFLRSRQKDPSLLAEFSILQSLFETKTGDDPDHQETYFGRRLMQFTGPLAAKGVEDTAFYTYDPLISHNEVGDTPGHIGMDINEFHHRMLERQAYLPLSLNASSTHDTKRGEDARIRLNVLSSMPEEWIKAVNSWRSMNEPLVKDDHGRRSPSVNDEYFIYQSLIGSVPEDITITDSFRERWDKFMIKALREAKSETCWDMPDEMYEQECLVFTSSILADNSPFLEAFLPFARKINEKASIYSLSQVLIKLTAPGIPDIYQGSELWNLSFVDPDNRLPVNYDERKYLLKRIAEEEKKGLTALLEFLAANRSYGAEKLFVIKKTLAYRKVNPELFTKGDYLPLNAGNDYIAYARRRGNDWLLVIVPVIRMVANGLRSIGIVNLRLPPDAPTVWKNELTGQEVQFDNGAATTSAFPVTLLSGNINI